MREESDTKRRGGGHLQRFVQLDRLAAGGWSAAGAVPLAQLPRLRDALTGDTGALRVEVDLQPGAGGLRLALKVTATLRLHCQRCLADFDWPLQLAEDLRLVASEAEEQRLLGDDEPYLVPDQRLPLYELIEDEVLLALPLVPHCGAADCHV